MRRRCQMAMIKLARSQRVKTWAQLSRAGTALATCYVAGCNAPEGVTRATQLLRTKHIRASLFYLGEYVDTSELVAQNVAAKIAVAKALGEAGLDVPSRLIQHKLDIRLIRPWRGRTLFELQSPLLQQVRVTMATIC